MGPLTAQRYCGTPKGYGMPFVAEGLRHGDVTSNDNTKPPSPIGLATRYRTVTGRPWNLPFWGPDLAPGDFRLFVHLKKHLNGKLFAADADVKQAFTSGLPTLDTDFFDARIQGWVVWEGKCLCVNDDNVEVSCVPSVTHVTRTSKSR